MVTLTDRAVRRLREILEQKGFDRALRIYVSGGGCSGHKYGMALDEPRKDDQVMEVHGLRVTIDPASAPYLVGAEVDFVDSLMGGGFSVKNPNAVSTCGCGHSFRTAASAGKPQSCSSCE